MVMDWTYRVVLQDPSGCAAKGSGKTTVAEAMPGLVEGLDEVHPSELLVPQ